MWLLHAALVGTTVVACIGIAMSLTEIAARPRDSLGDWIALIISCITLAALFYAAELVS